MKIAVPHTENVEVEIDEFKQKDITFTYLEKLFNWDREFFIEDGRVKKKRVCYSSHSFEMYDLVRLANEEDIYAEKLFNKIKHK